MGAYATEVASLAELEQALETARGHEKTSVIVVKVREQDWTEGGAFWQVGVPETSTLESVLQARSSQAEGLVHQRRGV
jgi:3D-(3,5/4)-trihydroxycyclohexane-1,2-dione acylhydrolase (decyclizing)